MHHFENKTERIAISMFAAVALLPVAVMGQDASARGDQRRDAQVKPTQLAALEYASATGPRQLTLQSHAIPAPTKVDLLGFLRDNPDLNALPNVVFEIVDAPRAGAERGRVVWAYYAFVDPKLRPSPIWNAHLTRDAAQDEIFVTLMRTYGPTSLVQVHSVDRTADLGASPLQLLPRSYRHWPAASKPLAPEQSMTTDFTSCGVSKIETAIEGRDIAVRAQRTSEECETIDMRFDIDERAWTGLPK